MAAASDEKNEKVPPTPAEVPSPLEPTNTELDAVRAKIRAEVEAEVRAQVKAEMEEEAAKKAALTKHITELPQYVTPPDAEKILIHFVSDGFTALETMWFRGQELEVTVGSREWYATLEPTPECRELLVEKPNNPQHRPDCQCRSWLMMSEAEQYRRYKEPKFRPGPWPGEAWEDEVAAVERSRQRKVPQPIVTLR